MRVIVTGANGHLGSTLSNSLARRGFSVKALVRNPSPDRIKYLNKNIGDIVNYDLLNINNLAQLFKNADIIFHTAAPTQLWSKKPNDIISPIYEGTLNIIRAAALASVPKIIYTSTGATVGFKAADNYLDENNYNLKTRHPQFRAKLNAELEGSRLASQRGVRFISVCPPNIIGPGFAHCSPSTEPYVRLVKQQLLAIPKVSYYTTDVRDLADAQILLAQKALHDRYIIGAHYATPDLLLNLAQELILDFKRPYIIPSWVLPGAWALDLIAYYASFKRKKRELTLDLLKECLGCEQKLSTTRFRSEHPSWQPRALHTTLKDMFSWIQQNYV
jgi:dihydroflavonol-4-reductase